MSTTLSVQQLGRHGAVGDGPQATATGTGGRRQLCCPTGGEELEQLLFTIEHETRAVIPDRCGDIARSLGGYDGSSGGDRFVSRERKGLRSARPMKQVVNAGVCQGAAHGRSV